jgi:allantoate deiminase
VLAVERMALETPGLMATVGRLEPFPGIANAVPGQVELSLDVRHSDDRTRLAAVAHLLAEAEGIAGRRGLGLTWREVAAQPAVPMDAALTSCLERAMASCGYQPARLVSGAGHDAMVMAEVAPAAMLFVRSPGGVSHHPDEAVLAGDVAAALHTAEAFVRLLSTEVAPGV